MILKFHDQEGLEKIDMKRLGRGTRMGKKRLKNTALGQGALRGLKCVGQDSETSNCILFFFLVLKVYS